MHTVNSVVPRVAYLLDTTIQVFENCDSCKRQAEEPTPLMSDGTTGKSAACCFSNPVVAPYGGRCLSERELAKQRALVFSCATVVVECSFIGAGGMSDEDSCMEAIRRGHTSWVQLRPHVEAHPETVFVLVHFSERYRDDQIREYFRSSGTLVRNVVLWLDSGIVDLRAMVN